MVSAEPLIVVHIVTFGHAATIAACLKSVLLQRKDVRLQLLVTDNHSPDNTVEVIREVINQEISSGSPATDPTQLSSIELVENDKNLGFSLAHNHGLQTALQRGAQYVLVLNPDVRLEESALARLVNALRKDPLAGTACPKLFRADSNLQPVMPKTLDASGMYITKELRHFDRGSEQHDHGQYDEEAYVFGGSGACLLLKREFILDAALGNTPLELFDNSFFAYREDADLAWRGTLLGWRCRYVPSAIGHHQRVVLPERRAKLSPRLNALGVQNRFLLQLNNFSLSNNASCLLPTSLRNIVVLGAVLLKERTSLPALRQVLRFSPKALRQHRALLKRQRITPGEAAFWFQRTPTTLPILKDSPQEILHSLTIIIVNYNSGPRLAHCLESIQNALMRLSSQLFVSVAIVDNASSDSSMKEAELAFAKNPTFQFRHLATNLGFSGAINHAALHAATDALLILNPDILLSSDCLEGLAHTLGRYPKLGALAPILEDKTGQKQLAFSARAFPTLGQTLLDLFLLDHLFVKNPWTTSYHLENSLLSHAYLTQEQPQALIPHYPMNQPMLVPQPPASCLLVRTSAFRAINGFDTGFWPAWFEDVDFCRRLSAAGWHVAITNQVTATHEGGYSAKTLGPSEFAKLWYRNLLYYWKKHGSRLQYIALRLLLPLALILRSALALITSFLVRTSSNEDKNDQRKLAGTLFRLALFGWAANPDSQQQMSKLKQVFQTTRRSNTLGSNMLGSNMLGSNTLRRGVQFCRRKLSPIYHRLPLLQRLRQHLRRTLKKHPSQIVNHSSYLTLLPPQAQLTDHSLTLIENKDWRTHFSQKLNGLGLEIGALHRPMTSHAGMRIHYADRLSVKDLRMHYPELNSVSLVEPDILDDAETLSTIADHSYDFLIAAHLIEHLRNPIFALKNWCRVVKQHGLIYLVVPDKRYTFDLPRPRTTIEHLILDYERPSPTRDFEHFLDYASFVGKQSGNAAIAEAHSLSTRNYSIHFHVFLPEDILNLLSWFNTHVSPIQIIEGPCKAPNSDEFHLLLQRV